MSEDLSKSAVSAIVLAAGMSRRMGTPKQLLRFRDRTLLELTIENVRNSAVGEIVLVLGFAADEVRKTVPAGEVKLVLNPGYEEGMASSLRTGMAALSAQAQAALIVLADQPCVLPATLDRLIAHYQRSRPQIVIPTYRGFRGNPVLLDRSVFPEVMSITGDIGCRAIFGSHTENIHRVEVNDAGILLDIDTRSDLEAIIGARDRGQGRYSPDPFPDLECRDDVAPAASGPDLVVIGRDAVAQAVLKLGRWLQFITTAVDPLARLGDVPEAGRVLHRLDLSLLPASNQRYIVVASRGQFDEDALEQALRSPAEYVGLLANNKRAQEVTAALGRRGVPQDQLSRLRAPAGLPIGAERPEEIALSVMAEIVAARRAGKSK